jgi:hypothetical protein
LKTYRRSSAPVKAEPSRPAGSGLTTTCIAAVLGYDGFSIYAVDVLKDPP